MTAHFFAASLIAVQTAIAPALAAAPADLRAPDGTAIVRANADCSGAAKRVVGETGGQLLSVSASSQGGSSVCVVTVLVPGTGAERPKKVTKTVSP